jgi:hypothetical protein
MQIHFCTASRISTVVRCRTEIFNRFKIERLLLFYI